MPSVDELQAAIGVAIAGLEQNKLALLEVFIWAGQPQMINDQDRRRHLMGLELARVSLPLIESNIKKAIRLLLPKKERDTCRDE